MNQKKGSLSRNWRERRGEVTTEGRLLLVTLKTGMGDRFGLVCDGTRNAGQMMKYLLPNEGEPSH